MSQRNRQLETLVSALLDGALDDGQRAQLADLLSESPAAREEYLDMLATHAALRDELGGGVGGDLHPSPAPAAKAVRRAKWNLWQFFRRPTPLSLSVAALVMGLLITAMAFMVPPFYRAVSRGGVDRGAPDEQIVAELTGLHNAKWVEGQVATHRGAHLTAGRRMELREGLAEVTFRSGATVTIEGPATWEIVDRGALRFDAGKLVAKVPAKAAGFTVETPLATIVDLGTEFGASVARAGATDARVFQGRVALASSQDDAQSRRILTAGQSVRVAADGSITPLDDMPPLVHAIELGGMRGQPQAFASYQFIGDESDPRTAIHAAKGGGGYPDDQRTKLIDGRVGSRNHIDGRWVGWFDPASQQNAVDSGLPQPAIVFDAGKTVSLDVLHVSYLVEHHLAIHAPQRLVVSTSDDGVTFKHVLEFRDFYDDWPYNGPRGMGHGAPRIANVELGGAKARYVRLEFYNSQEWTFLSEVRYTASDATAHP